MNEPEDASVRPISDAPTARDRARRDQDAQRRAEAHREALAAEIAADLARTGWAKHHPADDEQREAFTDAARRAGELLDVRVTVRTTGDGAVMAITDADPGPLRDRLDEARMRNAIDSALGTFPRTRG